jgi:hypothetical protein
VNIIQSPAYPTNYAKTRSGFPLNLIVIHTQQGFEKGTDAWFANPNSHVSAHYNIALSGEIDQSVQDPDTAFHAGNWEYNCRSLGLEFEDSNDPQGVIRSNMQYAAGADLIAAKCKQYAIPCDRAHIIGHREVPGNDHPACPGNEDIDRLVREANSALAAMGPQAAPPPPPPPTPPAPRGTVKITARPFLWLRTGPGTNFPHATGYDAQGRPIQSLPYGVVVEYVNLVKGEVVDGDPWWCVSIRGHYFARRWTNLYRRT